MEVEEITGSCGSRTRSRQEMEARGSIQDPSPGARRSTLTLAQVQARKEPGEH